MKKMVFFFLMIGSVVKGDAQNQQIKVYLQQIAANKAYIELLEKGYNIAKKGLKTIGDLKEMHFTLDNDFFQSLVSINPKVKNYAKTVLGFILLKTAKMEMEHVRSNVYAHPLFSDNEKVYIDHVTTRVKDNIIMQSSFLQSLITDADLKMSDGERIRRIDEVYDEARDIYTFVCSFKTEIQLLALQKEKEQKEVDHYRKAIDLK